MFSLVFFFCLSVFFKFFIIYMHNFYNKSYSLNNKVEETSKVYKGRKTSWKSYNNKINLKKVELEAEKIWTIISSFIRTTPQVMSISDFSIWYLFRQPLFEFLFYAICYRDTNVSMVSVLKINLVGAIGCAQIVINALSNVPKGLKSFHSG